jgi:hypothetical protein
LPGFPGVPKMVFRLDAVDAYERKLVKQIEVEGATTKPMSASFPRATAEGRLPRVSRLTCWRASKYDVGKWAFKSATIFRIVLTARSTPIVDRGDSRGEG